MNTLAKDVVEGVAIYLFDDERVALYRCNRMFASAQERARWRGRVVAGHVLPRGHLTWLVVGKVRRHQEISPENLPPTLCRLEILDNRVGPHVGMESVRYMPHLTDLSLRGLSGERLVDLEWAPHLQSLVMPSWDARSDWTPTLLRDLIENLTHLHTLDLGDTFDESLAVAWPVSLISLRIGDAFNRPIDTLPPMLQSLSFGDAFNWSIDTILWPETLTKLELGNAFDRPLVNLPPHLVHLRLGAGFQRSCVNVIWPPQLLSLHVSRMLPGMPAVALLGSVAQDMFGVVSQLFKGPAAAKKPRNVDWTKKSPNFGATHSSIQARTIAAVAGWAMPNLRPLKPHIPPMLGRARPMGSTTGAGYTSSSAPAASDSELDLVHKHCHSCMQLTPIRERQQACCM
jgi:hypothetical protein